MDNNNKIIFTNRDLSVLFSNIFKTSDCELVINRQKTTFNTFLNITFYSFKYDLATYNNFGEFDTEENLTELFNQNKEAYCLVESTNRTVTFANELDFETIDGRLTFIIKDDKTNLLDAYINGIREDLKGHYNTYRTLDNKEYSFYTSLGTLEQLGDTFESPLGKVAILQLDFKIGFINKAENFTSDYYILNCASPNIGLFLQNVSVIDETYTGIQNPVTVINRGGITGNHISNSTISWAITTYVFKDNNMGNTTDLIDLYRKMSKGKVNIDTDLELQLCASTGDEDVLYSWQVKLANASLHRVNSDWDTLTFTLILSASDDE